MTFFPLLFSPKVVRSHALFTFWMAQSKKVSVHVSSSVIITHHGDALITLTTLHCVTAAVPAAAQGKGGDSRIETVWRVSSPVKSFKLRRSLMKESEVVCNTMSEKRVGSVLELLL